MTGGGAHTVNTNVTLSCYICTYTLSVASHSSNFLSYDYVVFFCIHRVIYGQLQSSADTIRIRRDFSLVPSNIPRVFPSLLKQATCLHLYDFVIFIYFINFLRFFFSGGRGGGGIDVMGIFLQLLTANVLKYAYLLRLISSCTRLSPYGENTIYYQISHLIL